jgi:hypothetical protein
MMATVALKAHFGRFYHGGVILACNPGFSGYE